MADSTPAPAVAVVPVAPLEAEPDDHWEVDSSLGSDTESSTASLSSSIARYREENGRTYHAYKVCFA